MFGLRSVTHCFSHLWIRNHGLEAGNNGYIVEILSRLTISLEARLIALGVGTTVEVLVWANKTDAAVNTAAVADWFNA